MVIQDKSADDDIYIRNLKLKNYKGFKSFNITFSGSAYLIGPNNAGKSTLIQALRGCAHMIDHAFAKKPTTKKYDKGRWVFAYVFPGDQFSLITENIRHEFNEEETRIELIFSNGSNIHVVWPSIDGEAGEPFFCLYNSNGKQPPGPIQVKENFPKLGIVPTLMPIEHRENLLSSEKYIKQSIDTRRSSLHFRNQIYLLKNRLLGDGNLQDFINFSKFYTPEAEITDVEKQIGDNGYEMNVYYREVFSRIIKEISWIGDGMQIWFQILLHLYYLKDSKIIILDEPDVYLHADLQRRLVRLLEDQPARQIITATHSSEVLSEAEKKYILWVDRTRNSYIKGPTDEVLEQFSKSLGTVFNLRLAKALRTKVLLFVEGDDMKILQHIAKTLGAQHVSNEQDVTVVSLIGYSNWEHVEPFKWLVENFLKKSVKIFVLLDRDYRSEEDEKKLKIKLSNLNVLLHIWTKKELESYLLIPVVLSRLSGASVDWIEKKIITICEKMESPVRARMQGELLKGKLPESEKIRIMEKFDKKFKLTWDNQSQRLNYCPPKDIIKNLNKELVKNKYKPLSFREIAKNIRLKEIPKEMAEVIKKIETS